MALGSASDATGTERAELERVVAALERSPRLAKLLNFVGQKYLDGQADEITEYNIATEVFGRAKTSFDSTDSVARTEIYRLRKKLKEYYDTEGRDHPIQILIPFRTYVPEFIRRDSVTAKQQSVIDELASIRTGDAGETAETESPTRVEAKDAGGRSAGKRAWLYGGIAVAALALIAVMAFRQFRNGVPLDSSVKPGAESPTTTQSVMPPNPATVPLRLLAGYSGTPKIDSAGAYWQADRYFLGSAGFERPKAPIARTVDPMLFDHWRTGGDFSYDIPLAPGIYE